MTMQGFFAALAAALLFAAIPTRATESTEVKIGYLRVAHVQETVSILDSPSPGDGIAGAQLAIEDNNTTGRFLGQTFTVEDILVNAGGDPAAALEGLVSRGVFLIVADLPSPSLLALSDAASKKGALVFNVGAAEDSLREENCRANVFHIAPSHSMLADGLAQYLVWKQWKRWLLMKGSHPQDELFAAAIERAAKKFGAKIVDRRIYEDTGGGRRSDSGSVQTQRLIPVATQNVPAYDVLVAADESEVFANYLPYRTWDPRPVAGSAGLKPTSWDGSHEQWGAIQLQNRFMKLAFRRMNALDNNAWVAVRMIGEAAVRIGSNDPISLRNYLTGPDFAIAAFKGQKQTLRRWNQQLRQPILLGDGRTIVSVSPQEGFLHQTSELDTLGIDEPETKCKLH
jgi:ABC transporter substrate binding protein (PQQ-dependent alcohol dehydrogenase system)